GAETARTEADARDRPDAAYAQGRRAVMTIALLRPAQRGSPEVTREQLKRAVESQHGGRAIFVQSVPVSGSHALHVNWSGIVSVFHLEYRSGTGRAYAWSYERPDGRRRFFAVLHGANTASPRDAVRAAIAVEQHPA